MVAVDANILLEQLEARPKLPQVKEIIAKYAALEQEFAASTLSISHVFYLAESHKIAMKNVEELLLRYGTYDVLREDVEWALAHYDGKDFEDALQIAAVLREKISVFITIDGPLAEKYAKYLKIEHIA